MERKQENDGNDGAVRGPKRLIQMVYESPPIPLSDLVRMERAVIMFLPTLSSAVLILAGEATQQLLRSFKRCRSRAARITLSVLITLPFRRSVDLSAHQQLTLLFGSIVHGLSIMSLTGCHVGNSGTSMP